MYADALAEQKIFCSEKVAIKLGLLFIALAVFSGHSMQINALEARTVLKGYIQESNIYQEHSNNALFLSEKIWLENIQKKYGNKTVKRVENGIVYIPIVKYINSRRTKINVVEINRDLNKNIEIIPQLSSSKMHSKSKIYKIAGENDAIIAINGTYFKQDTGTPLGTLVINNEIISGPIYERVGFGIGKKEFKTSQISFSGEILINNQTIKLDNINQPRMLSTNILLYTPKWGNKSPATNKPSVHIAVKNNKIIKKANNPIEIPENGYIISAPSELSNTFKQGDFINIKYKLNPEWEDTEHIISGGPYLMKEGKIYIDVTEEKLNAISGKNPRTAIGYTKDNVMILVTVDGRQEGSSGVTLTELAKLMKEFGCIEAINLDGGSSTVMYVNGKTYTGSNIPNSVSVSNALTVRIKA